MTHTVAASLTLGPPREERARVDVPLFCLILKINLKKLMPLTEFDIQFEAISDVRVYEKHVGSLFNVTQVTLLQYLAILTFPWNNNHQFSPNTAQEV